GRNRESPHGHGNPGRRLPTSRSPEDPGQPCPWESSSRHFRPVVSRPSPSSHQPRERVRTRAARGGACTRRSVRGTSSKIPIYVTQRSLTCHQVLDGARKPVPARMGADGSELAEAVDLRSNRRRSNGAITWRQKTVARRPSMKEVAADWRCQSGCSCFSTAGGDIVIAFTRTNH